MPRAPRQTAGGLYHVATRAPIGEQLFRDEADFLRFETELELALAHCCCVCVSVCARYGRRGHAFAERYMSKPIAYDGQLLATYRYVARNPVEAGLCSEPGDWRWSSYSTLIGRSDRFAFADASIVLALCDGSLDALRRFVERREEAVPGTEGAWHPTV